MLSLADCCWRWYDAVEYQSTDSDSARDKTNVGKLH